MNFTYLRMLVYVFAPMLAVVPGVTYSQEPWQLVVDIEQALPYVSGALVAVGGIFGKWGKK